MNSSATPRSDLQRLKEAFPHLSASDLRHMENYIRDTSSEKTEELESDVTCEFTTKILRALVGRYRICRKLHDDQEYWTDFHEDYSQFAKPALEHEPCVIAAALAIRPDNPWEWRIVEIWHWVYRHALILDVTENQFEDWLEYQDPDQSREYVIAYAS